MESLVGHMTFHESYESLMSYVTLIGSQSFNEHMTYGPYMGVI